MALIVSSSFTEVQGCQLAILKCYWRQKIESGEIGWLGNKSGDFDTAGDKSGDFNISGDKFGEMCKFGETFDEISEICENFGKIGKFFPQATQISILSF